MTVFDADRRGNRINKYIFGIHISIFIRDTRVTKNRTQSYCTSLWSHPGFRDTSDQALQTNIGRVIIAKYTYGYHVLCLPELLQVMPSGTRLDMIITVCLVRSLS